MPRILIVDDDPLCHDYLARILAHEGYEVRSTADPYKAITLGADFKPDLLITDYLLRDTRDGFDVTQAIRASLPDLHVFMITGLPVQHLESRLTGTPAVRLFEKPLDLDLLLQEIRANLVHG